MNRHTALTLLNTYITAVDFKQISGNGDRKYFVEADELYMDMMNNKSYIIINAKDLNLVTDVFRVLVKYPNVYQHSKL